MLIFFLAALGVFVVAILAALALAATDPRYFRGDE